MDELNNKIKELEENLQMEIAVKKSEVLLNKELTFISSINRLEYK